MQNGGAVNANPEAKTGSKTDAESTVTTVKDGDTSDSASKATVSEVISIVPRRNIPVKELRY